MQKRIGLFLLLVFVVSKMLGNEFVSPRIKGFGKHLSFIVEDIYTDFFLNPAYINEVKSHEASLSFSLIGNGGIATSINVYKKENYSLGLITQFSAEYNDHFFPYIISEKKWDDANYQANYENINNSPLEDFEYYNNNTPNEDDDYTIRRVSDGIYYEKYNNIGNDFLIRLIYGKDNKAFQYQFSTSKFIDPPDGRQYAYNLFEREELGDESPYESVLYEYEEVNDYQDLEFKHVLSFAMNDNPLWIYNNYTINVWLTQHIVDNNQRKYRNLNKDPDGDGNYYNNDYSYKFTEREISFSERIESYKFNGYGCSFQYCNRKQINKSIKKVVAGKFGVEFLNATDYKYSKIKMTYYNYLDEFTGEETNEVVIDETEITKKVKRNYYLLHKFGYSYEPNRYFQTAFGVKLILNYSIVFKDIEPYYDGNDVSEDGWGGIVFPFGIEINPFSFLALRSGVNYHSMDYSEHIISGFDYSFGTTLEFGNLNISGGYSTEHIFSEPIIDCSVSYIFK